MLFIFITIILLITAPQRSRSAVDWSDRWEILGGKSTTIYVVPALGPGWPTIIAAIPPGFNHFMDPDDNSYHWTFTGSNNNQSGEADTSCTFDGKAHVSPCTGRVVEHTWYAPGTYKVMLVVTKNGKTERLTKTVEVKTPDPSPPPYKVAVRQEVRDLIAQPGNQFQKFVKGLLRMKRIGVYNHLSQIHAGSFYTRRTIGIDNRSAAHGGPTFPPWYHFFPYFFSFSF